MLKTPREIILILGFKHQNMLKVFKEINHNFTLLITIISSVEIPIQ